MPQAWNYVRTCEQWEPCVPGWARKTGPETAPDRSSEGGAGSGWRRPPNKDGGMSVVVGAAASAQGTSSPFHLFYVCLYISFVEGLISKFTTSGGPPFSSLEL